MFEEIDRIAKHFGLLGQQAKNYINWANWLFHEKGELAAGCAKIAEALKLAMMLDYEYIRILALLSYVSFATTGAARRRADYESELCKFVDERLLAGGRLESMADHRMVTLVKFLLTYCQQGLSPAVALTANSALREFVQELEHTDVSVVENGNPYFRPETKLWAVYY